LRAALLHAAREARAPRAAPADLPLRPRRQQRRPQERPLSARAGRDLRRRQRPLLPRRAEAAHGHLGFRRRADSGRDAGGRPALRAREAAEGAGGAARSRRATGAARPRRCARKRRVLPRRHGRPPLPLAAGVGRPPPFHPRMPELPDVAVYIEALEARIAGATLERVRLASPFLLRSVDPPITAAANRRVTGLRRLGKRIVIGLDGDLFLMLHLMIAGRLHWKAAGAKPPGKIGLAAFDFSSGTLVLTEAGTKRRAALYLVRGEAGLREHDPGGLEVFDADLPAFRAALTRENHTLKRALTDPGILSGIGNAYSDEILHRAKLSPVKQTRQLSEEDAARLFDATRATLLDWCDRI